MERNELTEQDSEMLWRVSLGIIGPIAAVATAGALVPFRSSLGVANVAIAMVLVVVATSALGGRTAGLVTAVVTALAFNYFHTQPYLSFWVAAGDDLITVVLLGIVATSIAHVAHRNGPTC